MRAGVVVLVEPAIDDDLSLFRGCEPLGIEDFPAERSIETLVVPVLPGRARVDPDGLHADPLQPRLRGF